MTTGTKQTSSSSQHSDLLPKRSTLDPFRDFNIKHYRIGGELLTGERVLLHLFLKGFGVANASTGTESLSLQGYGFVENLNQTTYYIFYNLLQPNSTEEEFSQPGHIRLQNAVGAVQAAHNFTVTLKPEKEPGHRPFAVSLDGLPATPETYELRIGQWRRFEYLVTDRWLQPAAVPAPWLRPPGGNVQQQQPPLKPQLYAVLSPFYRTRTATSDVAIALVAAHCEHHRRLGWAGTFLYIREYHVTDFLADAKIRALVDSGYLMLVQWENVVNHMWMDSPYSGHFDFWQVRENFRDAQHERDGMWALPYHDQVFVYGHALLAHHDQWQMRLAFIDADEFMAGDKPITADSSVDCLLSKHNHTAVEVRRVSIACTSCYADGGKGELPLWLAVHNGSSSRNPLEVYDTIAKDKVKPPDIKSIVVPGFTHSFGIHEGLALNGGSQPWGTDISDACGVYWLHLVNLFKKREDYLNVDRNWKNETAWHWVLSA